jgi:2-polyprenyl-3-methyl-5-hydroxy-6-metoxy-1,4-benzoquinol methylase
MLHYIALNEVPERFLIKAVTVARWIWYTTGRKRQIMFFALPEGGIATNHREETCVFCDRPVTTKLINDVAEEGGPYTVFLCEECMVGFTVPRPSVEELSKLYAAGNYRVLHGKRFHPLVEFFVYIFRRRRRRQIERHIGQGRILDIGCGRGFFLALMREHGWTVSGIEFNKETAAYASEVYGIDVRTGEPAGWGFDDHSFDVITITHVLEHVQNPSEVLSACGQLLRPGGLLVVTVPNIASLQAAAGKRAWFHLDIPYHLYHFSEQGLSKLLKKNSFEIAKTRRFDLEHNPFGWLQTLLNLTGIRKNLFYDLLKSPEARSRNLAAAKKSDLVLTFALLPLYLLFSLALSVFESSVLKRGGTFTIYAVKQSPFRMKGGT